MQRTVRLSAAAALARALTSMTLERCTLAPSSACVCILLGQRWGVCVRVCVFSACPAVLHTCRHMDWLVHLARGVERLANAGLLGPLLSPQKLLLPDSASHARPSSPCTPAKGLSLDGSMDDGSHGHARPGPPVSLCTGQGAIRTHFPCCAPHMPCAASRSRTLRPQLLSQQAQLPAGSAARCSLHRQLRDRKSRGDLWHSDGWMLHKWSWLSALRTTITKGDHDDRGGSRSTRMHGCCSRGPGSARCALRLQRVTMMTGGEAGALGCMDAAQEVLAQRAAHYDYKGRP